MEARSSDPSSPRLPNRPELPAMVAPSSTTAVRSPSPTRLFPATTPPAARASAVTPVHCLEILLRLEAAARAVRSTTISGPGPQSPAALSRKTASPEEQGELAVTPQVPSSAPSMARRALSAAMVLAAPSTLLVRLISAWLPLGRRIPLFQGITPPAASAALGAASLPGRLAPVDRAVQPWEVRCSM